MTSIGAREASLECLIKERRKEARKIRKEARRAYWAEVKATKARMAKSVQQTKVLGVTHEMGRDNKKRNRDVIGSSGVPQRGHEQRKDITCYGCKKLGHVQRQCRFVKRAS